MTTKIGGKNYWKVVSENKDKYMERYQIWRKFKYARIWRRADW
jgi:hypothetical protein